MFKIEVYIMRKIKIRINKNFFYKVSPGGLTMYWAAIIGVILFSAYLVNGLVPKRFPDTSQQKEAKIYFKKYKFALPVLQLGAMFTKDPNDNPGGDPDPEPQPQPTTIVSPTAAVPTATPPPHLPADIMLVIDTSQSMSEGRLAAARNAALTFVNIVQQNAQMRVGLDSFNFRAVLNHGLTNNYNDVKTAISKLKKGDKGGTCMSCSIDQPGNKDVLAEFSNNSVNPKKVIIFLSDAKANRYVKPDGSIGDDSAKAREQTLTALNNIPGAEVWLVLYDTGANQTFVNSLVRGEGRVIRAQDADFTLIYQQLARELL
jgi:hypothetical protein